MNCKSPLKLKLEDKTYTAQGSGYAAVPCGQCINCRINQSRVWQTRLILESFCHKENCFVTLTYDDDNNPKYLYRDELSKYIKRLRARLKDVKFKFYGCGEYGDRSWRPHFHIILFGLSGYYHGEEIKRAWSLYGKFKCDPEIGIHIGEVNRKSIRYITGYVTKKTQKDKRCDPRSHGYTDEFMQCSQGIGKTAVRTFGNALRRYPKKGLHTTIKVGGKVHPLGRYLTRSLNVDEMRVDERELKVMFWANQELYFEKCDRFNIAERRYYEKVKI